MHLTKGKGKGVSDMQAPAKVNLRTSVLDCRRVYRDMTDYAFATWYSKRYKVLPATILGILDSEKEKY